MSKNIRFTPPPPPPPPKNRDKSKNLRSVTTALRASTLAALGLLIALAVLLPNAAAEAQSSPASTATATATATPTDYDADNDGLIEINNLAQLNAVRHDLDGKGDSTHADYIAAFPNRDSTAAGRMGCPSGTCKGYELMRDLDFDTDGDGDVDASDTNSYANWTPIGTATNNKKFDAIFEGSLTNGVMPKISNLTISGSSSTAEVGLFGATSGDARIKNVGLVDVNLRVSSSSSVNIGALVGNNAGEVIACYSTGAIDATAGEGSYAGGLVGYNRGTPTDPATIAASFSRATVSMSIHSTATTRMDIIAGGLVGHNSNGTLTATYAAGAVMGKGGGGSYVGGLVGDNAGTITASYSIAPVTAAGMTPTATASNKPGFGGLIGYNDSSATITASYWDFISSGIDDDSDDGAMPEGKSTYDLISPTSATGIYADWDDLKIEGKVVDPWGFDPYGRFHPLLTYGGHNTTDMSGNQLFVNGGISSRYGGGNTAHPREGMTLYSNMGSYNKALKGQRYGRWWIWEGSTDGITWTTLTPRPSSTGKWIFVPRAYGTNLHWIFVPRSEHEGKYIRARMLLRSGDNAYTRAIGKIKPAGPAPALGFASRHNPPQPEKAITVAALPSGATAAAGLWYRCDSNNANPPSTGCELVGSRSSYTPDSSDLGHYLYAYIYYKNAAGAWLRAGVGFTPWQVSGYRALQWRGD